MPSAIRNDDLYHDRTVQDWHRSTFGKHDDAIDIDLLGACHRCRAPLYLIEGTTNPEKATTIIRKLAEPGEVPVFLVFHDGDRVTGGRQVYPARGIHLEPRVVEHALSSLRSMHRCVVAV